MHPSALSRSLRRLAGGALPLLSLAVAAPACLDRPVAPAAPKTTAVHRERVRTTAVDKIDLVFMIDNSASMADKAQVLAEAVADLVSRLADPVCVDSADGKTQRGAADAAGSCPKGSEREFEPIADIHIGIISSSLGGHGADSCSPAAGSNYDPTMQDMGRLVDRGQDVTTYAGRHFLAWDPQQKLDPPGERDIAHLTAAFQNMVRGVGQSGCGFEASLESIYRFLVDPTPYATIALDANGLAVREGVDDALLQERADFLRPDSLVSILYLSDENDASGIEGGQYYLPWRAAAGTNGYRMPRATSVCATAPEDPCCVSCAQDAPPGCPDHAADAECQKGDYTEYEDPLNLRAFHQKQRFGIDFLYPVSRYVDGLTQSQIADATGAAVKNPLFSDLQCAATGKPCKVDRDPSLVFFTAITGVPWQDIAHDPHDLTKGYRTTQEMTDQGVWASVLGDPTSDVAPADPLMIESVAPRSGTNPATGAALAGTSASTWSENPINGHEWSADLPSRGDDLQYACIFPLKQDQRRDCSKQTASCDCGDGDVTHSPLCQDPTTGAYGKVQYAAKAYPGLRALAVARGLGDQAIVASICPANLADDGPDYGYRPAIGALIDRLKVTLNDRCLPRILQPARVNDDGTCVSKGDATYGQVPCIVLEARNLDPTKPDDVCDCGAAARSVPNPAAVTDDVRALGSCVCAIDQLSGADLTTCQNDASPEPVDALGNPIDGWCYVDPGQNIGSGDLVGKCQVTEKRILRFVHGGKGVSGSTLFISCLEAAYNPALGTEAGTDPCP